MNIVLYTPPDDGHIFCPKCDRFLTHADDYEMAKNERCLECAKGTPPDDLALYSTLAFEA